MENCSRETETIQEHQMGMLELKVIRSEIKKTFEEFSNRPDTIEERICEFQVRSMGMIKNEA